MTLAVEPVWRRLRYTRLRDAVRGRLNGQLDWRHVVTSADLPTEIHSTIIEVLEKTRLWDIERVDVGEELIAHFQDGLDTGESVQTLVADFGDTAQAAALIRRAKKRNRPLWWRTLRSFGLCLGCFIAVYALLAIYMYAERPALDTDYLAVINSRTSSNAQGESAWPHYRQAMLALGWCNSQPPGPLPKNWYRLDVATLLDGTDDDDAGPGIREFLVEHQAQLAELRAATAKPQLGYMIGQSYLPEDIDLLGEQYVDILPEDEPKELISKLITGKPTPTKACWARSACSSREFVPTTEPRWPR